MSGGGCGFDRVGLVGDPVDVVSGAVIDAHNDFRVFVGGTDEVQLESCWKWRRYYDSSQRNVDVGLGPGFFHPFAQSLVYDLEGLTFVDDEMVSRHVPWLEHDGDFFVHAGVRMVRKSERVFEVEKPNGDVLKFMFDRGQSTARLTEWRTFFGTARLTYRGSQLEQIQLGEGRTVELSWDRTRLIEARLTQANGTKMTLAMYRYDRAGRLSAVTNGYGHSMHYQYNDAGHLVKKTDYKGYSFVFDYDAEGRCVHSQAEDGVEAVWLTYAADTLGGKTVVTKGADKQGGTWLYQYDANGTITDVIDPYGGKTSYLLDDAGRVATEVDPEGVQYVYEYDAFDVAVAKRAPGGRRIPVGEDDGVLADGRPAHWVGSNVLEWELGTFMAAPKRALTDEEAAQLRSRADIRRLAQDVALPSGGVGASRTLFVGVPEQDAAHRTERDAQGLRLNETLAGGGERRFWYDHNGNLRRVEDADGNKQLRTFRSWNLRSHDESATGSVNEYKYDYAEKLVEWKDAAGGVSTYGYDQKSRLVRIERLGGVKDSFAYDLADRLIEKRNAKGEVLFKQSYGQDGLVAARDFQNGDNQTFSYDTNGRLTDAQCAAGEQQFRYHNGIRTADLRDGRGTEHRVYGSRLFKTIVLDRYVTRYERTDVGTVTVTDPTGKAHTVSVLCPGVVQRRFANNIRELRQYSPYGEVLFRSIDHEGASKYGARYGYSREGDLIAVAEQGHRGEAKTQYEYDASHRLVGQTFADGKTKSFAHDRAGNVELSDTAAFSYGRGNLLLQSTPLTPTGPALTGQTTFHYDSRHRLSERRESGALTRYQYDDLDQLVVVERFAESGRAHSDPATEVKSHPSARVRFEYDVLGRRARKVVEQLSDGEVVETNNVTFYYDTDRLSAEVHRRTVSSPGDNNRKDEATAFTRVYVYPERDAIVPMLFVDYDGEDPAPVDGRVYAVSANHQGAVEQVFDAKGKLVWRGHMSPYGALHVDAEHESFYQPLRWPGHYHDDETVLQYNRFRYYAPDLCRYLQPDPLGLSGGDNLYRYTYGNPLSRVDVRGLNACPVRDGAKKKQDGHPGEEQPLGEGAEVPHTLYTLKSDWVAKDLANDAKGINPAYFQEGARFGPALYLVDNPETGAAEIRYHIGSTDGFAVVEYHVQQRKVKLLDLSDPDAHPEYHDDYREALRHEDGYARSVPKPVRDQYPPGTRGDKEHRLAVDAYNQEKYAGSRALARRAQEDGYTGIVFNSRRDGEGRNAYALFDSPEAPLGSGHDDDPNSVLRFREVRGL